MRRFRSWPLLTEQQSALGVAAFFGGAGIGHFVRPQFFEAVVPDWVPDKQLANRVSGAAEIALAVGMIPRATRRPAAWGLLGLLAAVFPANIDMALNDVDIRPTDDGDMERVVGGVTDARNWIRLPFQFVFAAWVWRHARSDR
ncbi:MAG: DoxX family protein [Acidimicrobiales bacterium]